MHSCSKVQPPEKQRRNGVNNVKTTQLNALHKELGGKMVPFAGYEMPVQYPAGIMKEHNHCRTKAALFDASHMGQCKLIGGNAAKALETLVPADYQSLPVGSQRYTQFTNDEGGILDDLMVTNAGDHLFVVVNAGCKEADFKHMQKEIGDQIEIKILHDNALLALQGPEAANVLSRFAPEVAGMIFMTARNVSIEGMPCYVSRSGYTGEDGYEIYMHGDYAEKIARLLLNEEEVEPAGLGARDSLRLEAGLCLYGHDIDTTTTPVEAALLWSIQKNRRENGEFPGANVIKEQIAKGTTRKRVGILPKGRAPARDHTEVQNENGNTIGEITSGGFGPTFGGPIAIGYVKKEFSSVGTPLKLLVRGKQIDAEIIKLPFVKQNYYRG
ncbi:MAG: glycine cleavage system aminomethyltransferase GcvT [Alphaproteobacteria bacterium]|nr:glycine cleavage system aminomethyltransferase GcvT [Alphaproteobacteria bacterium]